MGVELKGNRIEIACPQCDHRQMEPSMVISTLCRSCGLHMDIMDGQPVLRPTHATRIATPGKPPVQHASTGGDAPAGEPGKASGPGFLRKFFHREQPKRAVDCYHCHRIFEVVSDAQSSQCPRCGGYIALKDFDIGNEWRRRIQTRGDVTIQKGASIIGVDVQCHNLTVLGVLSTSVDCSGILRIRSNGKIIGNLKCRELRVERGVEVEFQGDVHADSAYIDGDVRAQLTCTGTITLEKKAHLQGPARAGEMVVKAGARHTGPLEVIAAAPAE